MANEDCEIAVSTGGVLGSCPVFDIRGSTDFLALPDGIHRYSSNCRHTDCPADCPVGVALVGGQTLTWHSDTSYQGAADSAQDGQHGLPQVYQGAGGGWQICFA